MKFIHNFEKSFCISLRLCNCDLITFKFCNIWVNTYKNSLDFNLFADYKLINHF